VLDALGRTDPALHEGIIQAYSHAIDRLFLVAIPVSVLSIIAALFIRQVQLRTSNTKPQAAGDGSSGAGSSGAGSSGAGAAAGGAAAPDAGADGAAAADGTLTGTGSVPLAQGGTP
jgi:hypothetical protein